VKSTEISLRWRAEEGEMCAFLYFPLAKGFGRAQQEGVSYALR
jgi:hypothetical protein